MNNQPANKVDVARRPVKARGIRLVYLSLNQPDFSPIEQYRREIKTILRKPEARAVNVLPDAIKQALAIISKADAPA
jgi:transposase